jgi:valyl-tRNA synthetase
MEDLMVRYHRMKGVPTLWVPGTDHAGIATHLQIEKDLADEGLSREEIGREEFVHRTWKWKDKYGGIITQQIRRLGASCDWERERFTLDDGLSKAVREAFVHLYDKGLIYQGHRMINWSPGLKTAISDLEVEYSEEEGKLYYFKYFLVPESTEENPYVFIPVATTRPETILGDTAVAVNPDDVRYSSYIGRKVIVPILEREIPVIGDDYVDREFGTGALKVTPGHDPNDFEIGSRHNLEVISILDETVIINSNGGPYEGLDRFEARSKLWNDMREKGLILKEEAYTHKVPRSQRGGEIIETMVSKQWFVNIQPLAQKALEAVHDGRITIIPDQFRKVYFHWLDIKDWCISRQLWWGHRIPVWYCHDCDSHTVKREDPKECSNCKSTHIYQDPDVLDTWFSSGLWPFSTLGWPEKTNDLKYFYPNTIMETGYDILFFWVARMIMMGLEFTGEIPFSHVYLHGLIRDENGKKMSKSYDNVIDPLVVMDELGTDAIRFTLLVGSTPGKDTNVSVNKVKANRNFANKLWNATRFVISNFPKLGESPITDAQYTLADSWIWARLQELIRSVDRLFTNYQYGEAGRQIYDFFWSEYADWYIEIAKLQIADGGDKTFNTIKTLCMVLDKCLRLLHPFTPFVTEELWQILKNAISESHIDIEIGDWPDALIIAAWPEPRLIESWEEQKINDFSLIMDVIRAIRNYRAQKDVKSNIKLACVINAGRFSTILKEQKNSISALSGLATDNFEIKSEISEKPDGHIALIVGEVEVFLPLDDVVNKQDEKDRIMKELEQTESQILRLESLFNSQFAEKAPQSVVQKEKKKLNAFRETKQKLQNLLKNFE